VVVSHVEAFLRPLVCCAWGNCPSSVPLPLSYTTALPTYQMMTTVNTTDGFKTKLIKQLEKTGSNFTNISNSTGKIVSTAKFTTHDTYQSDKIQNVTLNCTSDLVFTKLCLDTRHELQSANIYHNQLLLLPFNDRFFGMKLLRRSSWVLFLQLFWKRTSRD